MANRDGFCFSFYYKSTRFRIIKTQLCFYEKIQKIILHFVNAVPWMKCIIIVFVPQSYCTFSCTIPIFNLLVRTNETSNQTSMDFGLLINLYRLNRSIKKTSYDHTQKYIHTYPPKWQNNYGVERLEEVLRHTDLAHYSYWPAVTAPHLYYCKCHSWIQTSKQMSVKQIRKKQLLHRTFSPDNSPSCPSCKLKSNLKPPKKKTHEEKRMNQLPWLKFYKLQYTIYLLFLNNLRLYQKLCKKLDCDCISLFFFF